MGAANGTQRQYRPVPCTSDPTGVNGVRVYDDVEYPISCPRVWSLPAVLRSVPGGDPVDQRWSSGQMLIDRTEFCVHGQMTRCGHCGVRFTSCPLCRET